MKSLLLKIQDFETLGRIAGKQMIERFQQLEKTRKTPDNWSLPILFRFVVHLDGKIWPPIGNISSILGLFIVVFLNYSQ